MKKIAVLGAGSWGIAIACLLDSNGHSVSVWFRSEEKAERANKTREQAEYLPGVIIPESVLLTHKREQAVAGADIIITAIASKDMRSMLTEFKQYFKESQLIINCSKGLEESTLKTLSGVIKEVCPMCRAAVLSGPGHAEEVAKKVPTVVVASAEQIETAEEVQSLFMNESFRVYTNADMLGVELGGALKNVIALAAGISDGIGFGDNTKAALMTRGIVEISRLGVAMGANRLTFNGLSGIGDLIVTCTSRHSRNRRMGMLLGGGKSLTEAQKEINMVVEGVYTVKAAYKLSKSYNVEMPITTEIYNALFMNKDCRQAVLDLMTRDKTSEHSIEYYLF